MVSEQIDRKAQLHHNVRLMFLIKGQRCGVATIQKEIKRVFPILFSVGNRQQTRIYYKVCCGRIEQF